MFMLIHGLATFTDQTITDDEIELNSTSVHKSMNTSLKNPVTGKKRDITLKNFDFIYKRKIAGKLDTQDQFEFKDMMALFNAYEYWRYENINKQTFQ